jgi:pectinesterase
MIDSRKNDSKKIKYNAIVDSDSGTELNSFNGAKIYRDIADALSAVPLGNTEEYSIFIKNGIYYEKLIIDKPYISLIGDDKEKTVITYDDANGTKKPDGNSTYGTTGSASVTVKANNFNAENITFENGFNYPENHVKAKDDASKIVGEQAVALKTEAGSNKAVFKNCIFAGYQDTLFAGSGTQYYKNCHIIGHIDFIFGAGQAVFDECDIIARDRNGELENGFMGFITAPSTKISEKYGFVFIGCRLKKEFPGMAKNSYALGRPWHPTTDLPDGTRRADPEAVGMSIFINCWMDDHISETGWTSMSGKDRDGSLIWFEPDKDARFFEYGSYGPGAIKSDARKLLMDDEIKNFSIVNVLGGWEPDKRTD